MAARGRVLSDEEVERRLETLFPGEWFAVMGLGASRGNIKVARRKIRAAMPAGVQARILTTRKERWLDFLADRLPFVSERSLLFRALRPSRNLVRGIPTDETLQSIAWPLDKDKTRVGPEGLDALSAGFIYCAPFAPLSAENARKMVAITEKHAGRFGFEPAISLNLVDRRILEGVLSVHFDKRDLAQVERARLCVRAMHLDFLQEGFVPYRLDAESMDLMDLLDSDARPVLDEIKRVLDPSGVISPGRYLTTKDNPCSPSHPARRRSSAEAR
jgi:4-cresol dehydrogenase (hydroxylating)